MNRVSKQILYGLFYGAIWFFVIYSLYAVSIRPPVSCLDNVQNQDETGVDCGGGHCPSCELKLLKPIDLMPVQLLSSTGGKGTTALIEIRNPNVTHGTESFSYAFGLFGSSTTPLFQEEATIPVYPSEIKYRVAVNLPVPFAAVTRAVATTTAPYTWQRITELSRPKTPLRGVNLAYDAATGRATVTGVVKSDNAFGLHRVTLSALLYDKAGVLVGVSKTFVQDLSAAEERSFKIDVPLAANIRLEDLADPKVNVDAER